MPKRYFLDTEFIEDGFTIDLVSIGLVCEDGREYYAVSTEFNPKKASDWVKENVLPQLPPRHVNPLDSPTQRQSALAWKSREVIALEVMAFVKENANPVELVKEERSWWAKQSAKWVGLTGVASQHPSYEVQDCCFGLPWKYGDTAEFWADYCSYDWVALCQLFGTMMDLPKGFPMYCNDIQQLWTARGRPELPKQESGQHNALEDARYNKLVWNFLQGI